MLAHSTGVETTLNHAGPTSLPSLTHSPHFSQAKPELQRYARTKPNNYIRVLGHLAPRGEDMSEMVVELLEQRISSRDGSDATSRSRAPRVAAVPASRNLARTKLFTITDARPRLGKSPLDLHDLFGRQKCPLER
uniref:Uncharacterized protein n=1 Tax=Oryza punctata TaxID=4537 RepID=A0A0E0M285_ORYPU